MKKLNKGLIVLLVLPSLIIFWLLLTPITADLQVSINDTIRLKAKSNLGVPLHPTSGNRSVSGRLADGTVAKVLQIDSSNGWILIFGGS